MKKIRVLGLLVLLLMMLSSPKIFAQVNTEINYDIDVYLTKTIKDADGNVIGKDTVFTLTSGIELIKITQFSNFIRKVQFQVNPENPIMDFANPVVFLYVTMSKDIDGDGVKESITSNRAVLNSKGKLSFFYHYNAKSKPDK